MQAMILAAGFGTRLLPHTRLLPKPLFPILNRPLLLLTVRRLQRLGFSRIVVNCHHLGHQIERALNGLRGVIVQREETILGTGGGLRRALKNFADEPILVTNGDIYHTVDYRRLCSDHRAADVRISLAMHDCPRFNSVCCAGGRVVGFGTGAGALAFTGIHVVEPAVLADITCGQFSCIIDHYRRLLGDGEEIACWRADQCDGFFWTDIGTPDDYLQLHADLLKRRVPLWEELRAAAATPVDSGARFGEDVVLAEWNVIGRARVGAGAHLKRVVLWDGVEVPAGAVVCDRILSGAGSEPAFARLSALLAEAGLPPVSAEEVTPFAADGSTRRFWRLPGAVAVAPGGVGAGEMREAAAAWEIGRHLAARGCAVPKVYGYECESGLLVMEDLGTTTLYDVLQQLRSVKGDDDAILSLYRRVLARLVSLQVDGADGFDKRWCWETPRYDRQLMLTRESGYFLEAFWKGLLGAEQPAGISDEFAALADSAAEAGTGCFLHRDCQSRNIMIREGEPFFVDLQGGRLGPPGYDVASLLVDPYAGLSRRMQEQLVQHYYHLLYRRAPEAAGTESSFLRSYGALALQRNLQILGAFAFLSQQRGRPFFKRFLAPAAESLAQRLAEPQFSDLQTLRGMARRAVDTLAKNRVSKER